MLGENAPPSSTLCLWPAPVRSATVLLIMVMKLPYSFRVNREKSLSSWAPHSCTAGFLVLSRTCTVVSPQSPKQGTRGTYADVVELHDAGGAGFRSAVSGPGRTARQTDGWWSARKEGDRVRGSSESAMPSVVLGDVGRLGRGLHGTERGDVGSTLRLVSTVGSLVFAQSIGRKSRDSLWKQSAVMEMRFWDSMSSDD
jgi:hypothetical protein